MKKNKQHTPYVSKKTRTKRRAWLRNGLLVIACCGLFFASMYGFRCFATKVCGSTAIDTFVRDEMTILMPKGALQAEVANTEASLELGLSGRETIGENEGMLFIFDSPGRYGFWAKNMKFPFDIVWINQDGIVVDIERKVDPELHSGKIFMNTSEATYVLEMGAGEAEKKGLYLGSKVRMTD